MLLLMSPREARVIRNEALFREVNIRIADLQEGALNLGADELLALVCECAATCCAVPIEVDPATFEHVRENLTRFLVAPGHEDPDVESVVERRAAYLIVEKHSEPG
jgi:hypothetical protein